MRAARVARGTSPMVETCMAAARQTSTVVVISRAGLRGERSTRQGSSWKPSWTRRMVSSGPSAGVACAGFSAEAANYPPGSMAEQCVRGGESRISAWFSCKGVERSFIACNRGNVQSAGAKTTRYSTSIRIGEPAMGSTAKAMVQIKDADQNASCCPSAESPKWKPVMIRQITEQGASNQWNRSL